MRRLGRRRLGGLRWLGGRRLGAVRFLQLSKLPPLRRRQEESIRPSALAAHQIFRCHSRQLHLRRIGHRILRPAGLPVLPNRGIAPPAILHIVDTQAIAVVQAPPALLHIVAPHHRAEFSHPRADKNPAQKYLLAVREQVYSQVIGSHVHLLDADADAALPIPGFQLGKPDIFPFYRPLIGINI